MGPAQDGGVRIDGDEGGFAERTVNLTDIAWVLAASECFVASGAALDEGLVNWLRPGRDAEGVDSMDGHGVAVVLRSVQT